MLKSRFKRFFKSPFGQVFLATLVAFYVLILHLTCRVKKTGWENVTEYFLEDKRAVVALWHGRLLCMPFLFPKRKRVNALISDHQDGRLISKAASWWGIKTVIGSSSKGGAQALKKMVSLLKKEEIIFITPDGPRGPRLHLHSGTVDLAHLTGCPVIPVSISAESGKLVKSWDRFLIPRPFTTLYIHYGSPIFVRGEKDKDVKHVESIMRNLQAEADVGTPFVVEVGA